MTSTSQDQTRTSFHEATLVGVSCHGDTIDLMLNDVLVGKARVPISVTIEGARRILREGLPVQGVSMEEEDGEVLSLRQERDQVLLVVQWNNFAAKRQAIVTYNLVGGRIVLHAISSGKNQQDTPTAV